MLDHNNLEKLSPDCLSELRKKMVKSLIKGKQFNRNRLLGKYWRVILDGTDWNPKFSLSLLHLLYAVKYIPC